MKEIIQEEQMEEINTIPENHPGNGKQFSLEQVRSLTKSPLSGRIIFFLGSSVTAGSASLGISFADYLAKRHGVIMIKEAVSGTTLVDQGEDSYIARLKKAGERKPDLFVCQLSTNDASLGLPLGTAGASDMADCDTSTICGAIEFIIYYVKATFHCPVVFYTNPYYESEVYQKMVLALAEIGRKHGIGILDLYRNKEFNEISKQQRQQYLMDEIHPTRAGYLHWWLPQFETMLLSYFVK